MVCQALREWILQSAAAVWLLALCIPAETASLLPRSILILDQSTHFGPWPRAVVNSLRSTVASQSPETITFYLEHLDLFQFNGPQYRDSTLDYFRTKYRDKPIGIIVAIGSEALDYALSFRAALWPTVPVVFTAVDEQAAARKFPPGVTGITCI